MKNYNKWFWLGILATVLGTPNGTIIRVVVGDIDPIYFNLLRYGFCSLIGLPVLLKINYKKSKAIGYALLAGLLFSIAFNAYAVGIKLSSASYASLFLLITPAFFIGFSVKFNKESVSSRAAAGITLSALGAFVMVFLPIALNQNADISFYPIASLVLVLNAIAYPLATILAKKANESGLSMLQIIEISSIVVFVVNLLIIAINPPQSFAISQSSWLGIIYSGLFVAIISRTLSIVAYEHIGSVAMSALGYFGSFLAILLPVVVLGEQLSLPMIAGGILILFGIYIIEHHKSEHHKHFHAFRHH